MADEKQTPITRPAMPAQPKTVSVEKPPEWALRILEKMDEGFRAVDTNISLVGHEVENVKKRLLVIEMWKGDTDERQAKHSGGLTRITSSDEGQNAAIGLIKATVDATAAEVAALKAGQDKAALERAQTAALTVGISEALSGFWKRNPALERALVGLMLLLAAVAGAWLQGHN